MRASTFLAALIPILCNYAGANSDPSMIIATGSKREQSRTDIKYSMFRYLCLQLWQENGSWHNGTRIGKMQPHLPGRYTCILNNFRMRLFIGVGNCNPCDMSNEKNNLPSIKISVSGWFPVDRCWTFSRCRDHSSQSIFRLADLAW